MNQPCVCQKRAVRCLLCPNDPEPWDSEDVESCTPWEHIGYWITVLVVSCLTGGTVVGVASFVYGRWFA